MSEQQEEKTESSEEKDKRVKVYDVTEDAASKSKELRFTKRFRMVWIDDDGVKNEGEFTIKRPNLGDESRVGVLMAELRQDKPPSSLDAATAALHEWIAVCSVCVTAHPTWFDPQNMFDNEPLFAAYQEVVKFQRSFRGGGVEKRQGAAA